MDDRLPADQDNIGGRTLGMASTGYLQRKMPVWERLLSVGAGALLVVALPLTDELGFALGALVILQHVWRSRQAGIANA